MKIFNDLKWLFLLALIMVGGHKCHELIKIHDTTQVTINNCENVNQTLVDQNRRMAEQVRKCSRVIEGMPDE